jgi:hypothetical protein
MPRCCPPGGYCAACQALAERAGVALEGLGVPQVTTPALAPDAPEAALLAKVRALATQYGWLVYHPWRSDNSEPGYPDVTLAKPGRLIFAELKSATGKPTHRQEVWHEVLRQTLPGLEVYLWRPADYPEIVATLTRKETP